MAEIFDFGPFATGPVPARIAPIEVAGLKCTSHEGRWYFAGRWKPADRPWSDASACVAVADDGQRWEMLCDGLEGGEALAWLVREGLPQARASKLLRHAVVG